MRCEELERYKDNFFPDGFRYFMDNGVVCERSYYTSMQTNTAAALATITTGTSPAVHGVVGEEWVDYTTAETVSLTGDQSASSFNTDIETYHVSNKNIVVPTLGDELLNVSEHGSKVVTVATDATSAIVFGGMSSKKVYWLDSARGKWTTSNKYVDRLPSWIADYNSQGYEKAYLGLEWVPVYSAGTYKAKEGTVIDMSVGNKRVKNHKPSYRDYDKLLVTPSGNYMVVDFVKQTIAKEELGQGEGVDMLNVCFDTPRYISEIYGPESLETEDMLYRLDALLSELILYVKTECGEDKVLFVLTSDHGMSDSYDYGDGAAHDRFNVAQARVLLNGFLTAMYGGENWVLGYMNRNVYLNRQQAYSMGLDVAAVQKQASSFVLQFRGVSHVLTADDMSSGSFDSSYGKLMQNGFYQKRSGDLMINLMPGWIETSDDVRAASGSLYDYDRHVPLMFAGCGLGAQRIKTKVEMEQLPVTLAYIMDINRPAASTADIIEFFEEQYND